MATVKDIITGALRLFRIYDQDHPIKLANGLKDFNEFLSSLEEDIIFPTLESFSLTSGIVSYTMGNGGDFDTNRAISITSAYIRDADNQDHVIDVDLAKVDYDKIVNKNCSIRPTKLFFLYDYPLGTIYFNSAPQAETLYLTSLKPIANYTSIGDTIIQPPEFIKFLKYNLALDIAPTYGMVLDPTVVQQALFLKEIIRNRYSQPVPEANFDVELLGNYVYRTTI
jgi:hypothetical protein